MQMDSGTHMAERVETHRPEGQFGPPVAPFVPIDRAQVEGLDLFAGYAENFRAIGSLLLRVPGCSLDHLAPETVSNFEVGVQYSGGRLDLGATLYSIDFDNRIFYLGPQTSAGSI